jgi:uncharacterized cupin superfamily protein
MDKANVFTARCEYEETDPQGYRSGMARVGAAAGGRDLVIKLFELPAGESLCPYHYEYEEEWLLVLEGEVTVRTPDGTEPARAGDLVGFPPGPAGAHKVSSAGDATARVLMFSSAREPSVSIYPDSDKIGVWPGNPADHVILRRADGAVDYWEGETA